MNITIKDVRCSFPNLFTARAFQEGQDPKFGMTALLDKKKHAKDIAKLREAIKEVATTHFKGSIPKGLKHCLRDGSEKADVDGYGDDIMFVSTSSAKRPQVVDRSLAPIAESDNKVYAGCYVNISFRLWVQDNKFGKRVNAQLRAVQFVRDGDPFGEAPVDPSEVFEAMDDDDDEDASDLL